MHCGNATGYTSSLLAGMRQDTMSYAEVHSEAVSRITSTTYRPESMQEQGALARKRMHDGASAQRYLCVCRCVLRLVMKFTYATEPPPPR